MTRLHYQFPIYPDLDDWIILYLEAGSRAYGTSTKDSDHDYRGVAVVPRRFRDGLMARLHPKDPRYTFEQAESKCEPDVVIYSHAKFLALLAGCNPNIIEYLWSDPRSYLKVTPLGELLLAIRRDVLTKQAYYTFCGYAKDQLEEAQHKRNWLLNPPKEEPTREKFGLPEKALIKKSHMLAVEDAIAKQIEEWQVDTDGLTEAAKIHLNNRLKLALSEITIYNDPTWMAAARAIGLADNLIERLDQEKRYKTACRHWQNYLKWKNERNPARRALEAAYGYDTKNILHLVRLLRMCDEILSLGEVRVFRPDAEELLTIKHGAWTFDRVLQYAADMAVKLAALYASSRLPVRPDEEALDRLCQDLYLRMDALLAAT